MTHQNFTKTNSVHWKRRVCAIHAGNHLVFSILILTGLASCVLGQTGGYPRPLLPDQSVTFTVSESRPSRYRVDLKAYEFFQVDVESERPGVVLKISDTKKNELLTSDLEARAKDGEKTFSFSYVPRVDGTYFLDVTAPAAIDGNLKRRPFHSATEDDLKLLADLVCQKGSDLYGENKYAEAVLPFRYALSLYERVENEQRSIVGKLICIRTLGSIYFLQKDNATAIRYFDETSLLFARFKKIFPKADLRIPETVLLTDLAKAHFAEGHEQIALSFLKQINFEDLDYWKDNKGVLKDSLDTLGDLYISLGDVEDYDTSIKLFNRLIAYFQDDSNLAAGSFKDLYMGSLYTNLAKADMEAGYYLDSISSGKRSLALFVSIENAIADPKTEDDRNILAAAISSESVARNNIGVALLRTGNLSEAETYVRDALAIATRQGDQSHIVRWKANLGAVFARQKRFEIALRYFDETLPELMKQQLAAAEKFRSSKDFVDRIDEKNLAGFVGIILYYYGTILRETGQTRKALDYHKKSIDSLQRSGFRKFEARARVEAGLDFLALNNRARAEAEFNKAYELSESIKARDEQIVALDGLMRTWRDRNNRLAIFFGKRSVNFLQRTRSDLSQLGKNYGSEFVRDNENTYRLLADTLVSDGRIAEAEEVLAMLKEEENFSYLRRDDKVAKDLLQTVSLTDREKASLARHSELADKITAIGKEFSDLDAERKQFAEGQFPKQARYDELNYELSAAKIAFQKYLDELKVTFGQKDERVVQIDSSLQNTLKRLKAQRTAVVSTIVGEDRLNLIVTTANTQRAHTIDKSAKEINQLVADFRKALTDPRIDPRPTGQKLYDILVKPLEGDLKGIDADTILWSLDGTLRYIPVAALWDRDKGYLAERFSSVVLTLASRDTLALAVSDKQGWKALGVGVSKPTEGFTALDAVPDELDCIVTDSQNKAVSLKPKCETGVINGRKLLDEKFTATAFEDALGRYAIVHIASHFSLNPGNDKDSFLLLGGGEQKHFTVEDLRSVSLTDVELLVLSACNTATPGGEKANGVEIEGFGAVAQKQGAKAVMATLWPVADESTRDLMVRFYELYDKSGLTKAEAMRQAQLEMLHGKSKQTGDGKTRAELVGGGTQPAGQPTFKKDPNAPYSHPYYWAPFVLFGNWR